MERLAQGANEGLAAATAHELREEAEAARVEAEGLRQRGEQTLAELKEARARAELLEAQLEDTRVREEELEELVEALEDAAAAAGAAGRRSSAGAGLRADKLQEDLDRERATSEEVQLPFDLLWRPALAIPIPLLGV